MDFEKENPKLKAVLLVLLAILVVAILVTVYFINREAGKTSDNAGVGQKQENQVKPLTADQIQEALQKTADTGEAGEDGTATPIKPLTQTEIQSALSQTSNSTTPSAVKPLTDTEIQDALSKTK